MALIDSEYFDCYGFRTPEVYCDDKKASDAYADGVSYVLDEIFAVARMTEQFGSDFWKAILDYKYGD